MRRCIRAMQHIMQHDRVSFDQNHHGPDHSLTTLTFNIDW